MLEYAVGTLAGVFLGWAIFSPSINPIYGAEYGYFEGQKDAIQGDVRIDIKECKRLKSPWDDAPINQELKYRPEFCD